MNKPIYDVHLEVWQATAEAHQGQLYRCLPSLESEYRERGLAAGKVASAIEHYKAICTRTPADAPPAEAAMPYGSPAPA
ncbi:MAG: hypothetical protein K2X80_12600, partial [Pseudomonadaceae bacterium]|nr:hypothetical protein [Pseudomonadaceae bacterium]